MLAIYKIKGETPLQSLNRLKMEKPEYASIKLSYAGRLDPMAEGVMLVLVGNENKERKKYLGLDKTYVTEILFGLGTDTGDILGVVDSRQLTVNSKFQIKNREIEKLEIQKELKKFIGKMSQKYPTYSSKSFARSYEDVRNDVNTNKEKIYHDVEVYSADLIEVKEISAEDLLKKVKENVSKVVGDFRQKEIIQSFEDNLSSPKTGVGEIKISVLKIIKIRLFVSSGFYVRQFAEDFGEKFAVPALALSILREKVGDLNISDCIV